MPPTMKLYSPPKKTSASYARQSRALESYRGGASDGSSEASSARTALASPNGSPTEKAPLKASIDQAEKLARGGNLAQAEQIYREAVSQAEKDLADASEGEAGSSSVRDGQLMDALRAATGLARVLRLQGKYDESETIYRSSLTRAEGWRGASDPGTLKIVNFLALLLSQRASEMEQDSEQGRAQVEALNKAAEEFFHRAHDGFELALGPQHPDTLSIVSNLANFHADMGHLDDAVAQYRRALAGLEQSLAAEHPATCSTMNGLATILAEQGEYDEALGLFQRALEGYEKSLGATHPETLSSVHNMATVLGDLGEKEAAEAFFKKALAGRMEAYGQDHPSTIATTLGFAALLGIEPNDLIARYVSEGTEPGTEAS